MTEINLFYDNKCHYANLFNIFLHLLILKQLISIEHLYFLGHNLHEKCYFHHTRLISTNFL